MITSLLILRFCFPRDWVSKLIFSKCHRHGSQNTLLHVALHLHHRKRCVWLIIKVRVPSNLCVIYFNIGGRVGSMTERLMFFSFYFFPSFFLSLPSFLLHPAQILKDLTKETNFSHVYLSSSFQPLRKVNDHRWHSSGKWRASPSDSALFSPWWSRTLPDWLQLLHTSNCGSQDVKILKPVHWGAATNYQFGHLFPIASDMVVLITFPADTPSETHPEACCSWCHQSGNSPLLSGPLKNCPELSQTKTMTRLTHTRVRHQLKKQAWLEDADSALIPVKHGRQKMAMALADDAVSP